ncbi:MAG: hypothetical protein AB8G77_17340 [Rhodothermales bacterium]
MNILLLIAGILTLFAFTAHAFIGDKEYRVLKPGQTALPKNKETWIQTRAGWHWVSTDLLLSGILLLLMATTDMIEAKAEIALLISIYFFACGIVWLFTVVLSKTEAKQIYVLGQWVFCFLVGGLIYAGI